MNPVLFNAAKGAERAMHAQHVRANNLSNIETVGFKAIHEFTTPQRLEGVGFDSSVTTRTNAVTHDHTQGLLMATGRDLDVAVSGKGFLSVEGKAGEPEELYTRVGKIHVDEFGEASIAGRPLVGVGGRIVIPEHERLTVSKDGVIFIVPVGGEDFVEVDQLKLVDPALGQITLDRSGLFASLDGNVLEAGEVEVEGGHLESSNVSGFNEMVSMMNLSRQFEVQVKVMSKADEIFKIGNSLMKV
ncbi:flagellar basal body rod protein FlgF [Vibrio barjaei]|uniref:flagellar basal body rod protein FlgF n=1 Tax=Vibrio barjaei TaxID=1676683 RepID=UPI00228400E1|nr:flagellar basal body rod protein FlgF [Vibrio barjaei]MCY9872316.1 flagellar basal body rod protein FlgF [Vibrio barjaei]